ncbi:MAG: tetratricopeptide repeat protein [Anaerolineae bacterium]|nr:tetratricopeptide repeat protein [Anaerolineae bacterium]
MSNFEQVEGTLDLSQLDEPLRQLITSREFEKLVTVANLSQRGSFVIALYNTPASRDVMVAEIKRRIAPQPLFKYAVSARHSDVYGYIKSLTAEQRQKRAVISVTDIEAGWETAPRWLDLQRDRLAAYPHTLILWLQYNLWGKLAEQAPNFFSRHSGVFDLRLTTTPVSEKSAVQVNPTSQMPTEPGLSYNSVEEWEQLVALYRELLAEQENSPLASDKTRFDLHYRLAWLYQGRSFYLEAQDHYQRANALLDREAEAGDQADMLYRLGQMHYFGDEYGAALESYQQALALFRAVGARLGEANTLKAIGFQQLDQGDGEAGLQSLQAALSLHEQINDRVGQANIYWGLGWRLVQNGELTAAESLLAQAVALGNQFAPGHPVTQNMENVLAQVRAQLDASSAADS